MEKAVILAAGRGSRMRRSHTGCGLDARQAQVASTGLKAMMPVGRPFIDYVLSGLVEAGYRRVCLVIGPDHQALQAHCSQFARGDLDVQFAIQTEPLGTANAVASARDFVAGDAFLLINSDNYYPASALAGLRKLRGSALAAFKPEGLCRGNITAERLRSFALIELDSGGQLTRIIEKPGDDYSLAAARPVLINMNCWRFRPVIFEACRAIPKSSRGEYELPDAVSYAIAELGERFSILEVDEPVLDLSTRADVAEVARRLSAIEVRL